MPLLNLPFVKTTHKIGMTLQWPELSVSIWVLAYFVISIVGGDFADNPK